MESLDILFAQMNINTSNEIDDLINKVEKLKINNGMIKTNDKIMKEIIINMGELNLIPDNKKKAFIKNKLKTFQKRRFKTGYKKNKLTNKDIDDIFNTMFEIKSKQIEDELNELEGKDDDGDVMMGGKKKYKKKKAKKSVKPKKKIIKKPPMKKGGSCGKNHKK